MAAGSSLPNSPLGLALIYSVFGVGYILFSDSILASFAGDYARYQELQTFKGWAFILFTSVGLWLVLRWAWIRLARTVQEAVKAEDQLRLALTAADGLTWKIHVSPHARVIQWDVSGGLARELGLPEGRRIGLDEMLSHLHPADRDKFQRRVERVFAGEPEFSAPIWRYLRPEGSHRWVKLVPDPKSRAGTTDLTMGGVAFDLTQQQQIAQDLEEVIFGAELGTWRLHIPSGRNQINDRYAELLGYSRAELEPMSETRFFELLHPDDLESLRSSQLARSSRKDYMFTDEVRMRHKDGHWVWILTRCRPVEFADSGEPLVMSGVHIDISLRKELEAKLKIESDHLRRLTETSVSGILTVNDEVRISFANREAASILEIPQDELIGLGFQNEHWVVTGLDGMPLAPDDFPSAEVLRTLSTVRDKRVSLRFSDGRRKSLSINAAPMVMPDGKSQVVATVTEITAQLANDALLRDAAAEAQYAALNDRMTGLPNRELFEDYLNAAIATAAAAGTCLMHVFLDIDNFKQVNDRFGHHTGDLLIQKVSERLEQVRKGRQVLARVAGDEFAFLHPHDGQEDTDAVLQSLSKAFDRPFDLLGHVVYVTVSIGVSAYPQDATALQDLWVNADLAMYEAKTRGRNRVVRYATILREKKIEEARIAQVLQGAIKARAFSIVLQPQVRLDGSGRLDGAEALLRCTDPDLKDLGPGAYLPVAEHAGLMRGLDLIVADLVGEAVSRLRAEGFALRVSMNLSPDSLQQMSFGQDLFSHLEVANLGPTDVRFELTEGALVDLSSHARETLDLMHNRGFELSADDFGTGYSSLSYLHRLRLTEIKIDRSFVQRLGSSEEPSDEIVRAILAMGQALSLCVVAEGIETEAQVDWLSEHGCTLGQGYYFGRGLDIDAFLDQLRKPFLSKVTALSGLQSDVGQ